MLLASVRLGKFGLVRYGFGFVKIRFRRDMNPPRERKKNGLLEKERKILSTTTATVGGESGFAS